LHKILCFNNSNNRSPSGTNNTIDLSMHHIRLRSLLGAKGAEDIPGWAAKVRKVMAKVGEISLLELQRRSRLSLLDLWLGLLLGDTGCSVEHSGGDEGFYRRDGLLVLGIDQRDMG
jgi:hypothetical protein